MFNSITGTYFTFETSRPTFSAPSFSIASSVSNITGTIPAFWALARILFKMKVLPHWASPAKIVILPLGTPPYRDPDKIEFIKHQLNLIPEILRYRLVVEKEVDKAPTEKEEIKKAVSSAAVPTEKDKTEDTAKEKVGLNELDLKIDELLSGTEDNL